MKVLIRAYHLDFQVAKASHTTVDRRHLLADHCSIAHEADIRLQELFMSFDPSWKRRRTDFFLALKEELHIVAELSACEQKFKGLDVHK